MSERQATCEERVDEALESTMSDVRELWACYTRADCPKCEGEGEKYVIRAAFPDSRAIGIIADCDFCEGTGTAPESHLDLGEWYEYGLSFEYVPADERDDQAFWRYLLSWGGPSDEFRFFASHPDAEPYRIEYWFLDWFDGAHRILNGTDRELLGEVWADLQGMGSVQSEFDKVVE